MVADVELERGSAASPADTAPVPALWRPSASGRRIWWAGLVPFVLLGAVRAGWFAEGDTFWQIATGRQLLTRHTIFLADTFSWTITGRPWHPNSWLFDVVLAAASDIAGPLGLAAFTVILVTALGVGVTAVAARLPVRPLPLLVTFTLFLLPALAWISTRPQTLTYALLPPTLLLTVRALYSRGRRLAIGLLALYLLTAVWTNLHLASLGVLPAVAAGMAAVMVGHRRTWRRLVPACVGVLGAVVLGCASSPYGFGALTSALATRDASARVVVEWAPLWHTSVAGVLTWIGAAIAVALAGAAWRHRPQDPLLATSTAGAAALFLLGITAARFSPMALVAALPAVAAWSSGIDWTAGRRRSRVAFLATGTAVGLLAALLLIAGLHLPDLGEPSPADFPTASTIESIPAGCRVLNEYDDGGYLLLLRHPDGVRVAMDGRNDVYGATLIAHLQSIISGRPGALAELRRNHVGCLLLDPDRPLVHQALAGGWKTAARDAHRTLLISPPSQPN